MNTWIKKLSVLVSAGVVYIAGQYFLGNWLMGTKLDFICHPYVSNGRTYCHSLYLDTGLALIAAGEALAIVGVILLFANAAGLRRWLWFSLFYLPLAAITVIWFTPTAPCLVMCGTPAPDYTNMVWNFGYPYIFITLCIVLYSRFRRPIP